MACYTRGAGEVGYNSAVTANNGNLEWVTILWRDDKYRVLGFACSDSDSLHVRWRLDNGAWPLAQGGSFCVVTALELAAGGKSFLNFEDPESVF